jgi:formylglycine-generating enzyme required for sulfatase activity
VLDFGLAKVTSEGQGKSDLTREGQMLGTPEYIAPEQIRDAQSADIRADVYSLGCTLYYLLSGRPPFVADHVWDVYSAHISTVADPLNLVRPEVPVEVAALVAKMLAKEPSRRFQTPGEIAQALAPFFKLSRSHQQIQAKIVKPGEQPAVEPSSRSRMGDSSMPPSAASVAPESKGAGQAEPGGEGVNWESLIHVKHDALIAEPEKPKPAAPSPGSEPIQRRQWKLWPAALAAGALGLVALSVVIFTTRASVPQNKPPLPNSNSAKLEMPANATEPSSSRASDGPRLPKEGEKSSAASEPQTLAEAGPAPAIANSLGMSLILIPAGEFLMGSPENDWGAADDEKPQRRVQVTRPFYLGAHEVTQAQYRTVMGINPSWFSESGGGKSQVEGRLTERHPVEDVSWFDSVRFCNLLSEKEGLKPFYQIDAGKVEVQDWSGPGYRLPTEAEWEYSCRAGEARKYSFGDDQTSLGEFAWFRGNSDGRTYPVGEKGRNAFGVFDTHGGVWEWCWDYYAPYGNGLSTDPNGPAEGAFRVMRGGSFWDGPQDCRSAYRDRLRHDPNYRYHNLGFRVARGPRTAMETDKGMNVAGDRIASSLETGSQTPQDKPRHPPTNSRERLS